MTRDAFRFFHPFRVRYSEIDGQGVVFNAHYLTWFDTAITEYFRAIGYDQFADAKKTGLDFHVVRSLVEYRRPILFDAQIEVGARVARIGRSSITFGLAIFPRDADTVMAQGEIVWVCTDQAAHRSAPVGEALRALILARDPGAG